MKIAFLSAGAPRHGVNMTKEVQQLSDKAGWGWQTEFWDWKQDGYDSYDFSSVNWAWWVGCFGTVFQFIQARPECKHIAQFIGTDVLQHVEMMQQGQYDPFDAATIHIADATNLQAEVKQFFRVDCGFVRSIPPQTYAPKPITRWDNTMAYVPPGREDFFRWAWILELAKDYPDITFNVVPRPQKTTDLPNVNEMDEISGAVRDEWYEKCFAYLRPIEHDGVGLTMIEFAQLGRFVFHSDTRIPHVLPARSVGEMEVNLDRILERKQPPDKKISEYYTREFSYDALDEDMKRLKAKMEAA